MLLIYRKQKTIKMQIINLKKYIPMKTKIIFLITILLSLNAISQREIRSQLPYKPSKNKGNGIVLPLTDPINFFYQNMFGSCVNISNLQINYAGNKFSLQMGIWNDSSNTLGIEYGIILSTGNVFDAIDSAFFFASTNVGGPGDSFLSNLVGFPTYDAIVVEFDFVPLADSVIPFEFIFASEEYPEWVGSNFNDVFGFFIEGPGYNGLTNIAFVPGTNLPIAINNVNNITNNTYYVDNANGTFLSYDGYTALFMINVPVIANQQYHFKLALADVSDEIFDSAIILKAGSFAGNISQPVPSFTYTINGNTVTFTNTTTNGMSYYWDFGDGTTSTEENPVHQYSSPQIYQVLLKAYNHCYESEIYFTIDLLQQNFSYNDETLNIVSKISDGIYEITGTSDIPEVYNITGIKILPNIVQKENSITIDITALPKGLYILKTKNKTFKLSR